MSPSSLPPVQQDPAVVRAGELAAELTAKISGVRTNRVLSDLAQAREITAVYEAACAERVKLWDDMQGRRLARLQHLETRLPLGPGIAAGTSAADRAVLMTAFRAAVEQARAANDAALQGMLNDARRFGDDMVMRAVFTVAVEEGRSRSILAAVRDLDPAANEVLAEMTRLRAQLDGRDVESHGWEAKAFWPIPVPEEVRALPMLEMLAENRHEALP